MEQCYLHIWWYLFDFSPLCIFKCVLKSPAWTDAKSHRLHLFDFFSIVHLQMCPQTVCHKGRKITLVAFVWLFSTVHFQMCPQTVCPRGRIITLVAFVGLFSTVPFQLCIQVAWRMQSCTGCNFPFHWRSLVLPPLKMSHITMNTKTSFHVYA